MGAIATALFTSAAAHADEPCAVRVEASDHESTGWSDALRDAERAVAVFGGDCREIVIVRDDHGASLTFTTRDGRVAQRRISQPTELRALIEALLVTIPEEPRARSTSVTPARESFPLPTEPAPTVEPAGTPDVLAKRQLDVGHLLLGVGGGVKVWPGSPASAVGQVAVAWVHERWELGLIARWEPGDASQTATGHLHVSALGGRATLGRREPIGDLVLVFGSSAGVFVAQEDYKQQGLDDEPNRLKVHDAFVDPRLGAYVGLVVPTSQRFRLRAQVDGEVALSSYTPESAYLTAFPRWNFGLTLGAEAAFLP
jgi:hypothetical protein